VPTGWIYRQSRAGAIPTVKLGRYYRYRLEAIERWMSSANRLPDPSRVDGARASDDADRRKLPDRESESSR
jgi:hypothetical protein